MQESTIACLVRIKTTEGFRSHLIEKSSFTIGRTQDADLPILQQSVSRVHLSVQVKDDGIWISDRQSANGTFVNDRRLMPGELVFVSPADSVRLGTSPEVFGFYATPKPFELLSAEKQKDALMASMEDLAKDFQAKSREQVEKELRQARAEAERLVAHARREIETLRTQEKSEAQTRRQAFENEMAKLVQEAHAVASQEKLKASKEADLIIAEAQRQIQKDIEESGTRADVLMKETHAMCARIVEDAEAKARALLAEAREEAARLRLDASEEAHAIHREASRKGNELLSDLQQEAQDKMHRIERESAERAEQLLFEARREAEKEKERFLKDHAEQKQAMQEQMTSMLEQSANLKNEINALSAEKSRTEAEFKKLRDDYERAVVLLGTVTVLEEKRTVAERQLKEFNTTRENGLAKLDQELKDKLDRIVVEIDAKRKEQENDLAKARLKAMEDVQAFVSKEEAKYEKTKRLRAVEISQNLAARLLTDLQSWLGEPSSAPARLKKDVEETVFDVLVSGTSSVQAPVVASLIEEKAKTGNKWARLTATTAVIVLIGLGFYGRDIYDHLNANQKDSFANTLIERRRIQSIYTPEQTREFRDSYSDNILFMKNYLEIKSDPKVIEKWTLKLTDLEFLRPLKLSEEDVVKFIARETNLVQRLATIRGSIDAVYLNEGLARMHEAEKEDIADVTKILKNEDNYRVIRTVEREFILGILEKKTP